MAPEGYYSASLLEDYPLTVFFCHIYRKKSPLLPPDFASSCTLRITIPLSSALVMS